MTYLNETIHDTTFKSRCLTEGSDVPTGGSSGEAIGAGPHTNINNNVAPEVTTTTTTTTAVDDTLFMGTLYLSGLRRSARLCKIRTAASGDDCSSLYGRMATTSVITASVDANVITTTATMDDDEDEDEQAGVLDNTTNNETPLDEYGSVVTTSEDANVITTTATVDDDEGEGEQAGVVDNTSIDDQPLEEHGSDSDEDDKDEDDKEDDKGKEEEEEKDEWETLCDAKEYTVYEDSKGYDRVVKDREQLVQRTSRKSVRFEDSHQTKVCWDDEAHKQARCIEDLDQVEDANWSRTDCDVHSLLCAQRQWQCNMKTIHLQLVQVCTLPKSERPPTHKYKLPCGPPIRYEENGEDDAIMGVVHREQRQYYRKLCREIRWNNYRKAQAVQWTHSGFADLDNNDDFCYPDLDDEDDFCYPDLDDEDDFGDNDSLDGGELDLEQQQPPSSSRWEPILGGPLLGSVYKNSVRRSARFVPAMGTIFLDSGVRKSARLLKISLVRLTT